MLQQTQEQDPFPLLLWGAKRQLMGYAMSLCKNRHTAEDLVLGTLVRAMRAQDSFQPGTNLQAWLTTILRNSFLSQYRASKREVLDEDGHHAARLSVDEQQTWHLVGQDILTAIDRLTPQHREAVVLVLIEELPYETAAAMMGVPVGTVKSRLSRARKQLQNMLEETEDASTCPRWLLDIFRSILTEPVP